MMKPTAWLLALLTGCNAAFYTTGSSVNSSQSSGVTTNSTSAPTAASNSSSAAADLPSSLIVGGSALLAAVAGGIITTVYAGQQRNRAQLEADEFRKAHPPLQPPVTEPPPATEPPPLPTPPPPAEPTTPPSPQSLGEPSLDAMVMAHAWLRANEVQLKQDLALGAGPALDDLAGIAGIPQEHRLHFGQVLQRHRRELLPPRDASPWQAAAVMSRVGALVMADPLLRPDGEAALAAR